MELKVSSLNTQASVPYIRIHGKGDKKRIVSVTDKTVAHLMAYLEKYRKRKIILRIVLP
ncbi:hypothetical protein [Robinsoniella sp. RHS]|uniref:hypothetical protein n=1 Tax=Robinsoniella sp. RHS TaxID=1504536 RepID=UPI0037539C97